MKHTLINGMEYFAKKTFSFLQDCALTSINNTSTNTSTTFLQDSVFTSNIKG